MILPSPLLDLYSNSGRGVLFLAYKNDDVSMIGDDIRIRVILALVRIPSCGLVLKYI